jgi:hypothetical protein
MKKIHCVKCGRFVRVRIDGQYYTGYLCSCEFDCIEYRHAYFLLKVK